MPAVASNSLAGRNMNVNFQVQGRMRSAVLPERRLGPASDLRI
jgi:hypothetical protein